MSHCVSVEIEITDLDACAAACTELGATLVRDQTTFKWWGSSVGDYPLPEGFTAADMGHCQHAIQVPGTDWEIGLVENRNGRKGYTLLFDFYGPRGGPLLKMVGGKDAARFKQIYGVHKAQREAVRKGYATTRTTAADGTIRLTVTGRFA